MHDRAPTATDSIGLSALGYYLPENVIRVDELVAAGRMTSSLERLQASGFVEAREETTKTAGEMARAAVDDLVRRSGFDLSKIDLILHASGMGTSTLVDPEPGYRWSEDVDPVPMFRFAGTRLQFDLGLPRVPVFGISQLACSTLQASLRVARAFLRAEPGLSHVLCVGADRFGPSANREIVYSLMSDGAAAAVVSRAPESHHILGISQLTRGVYWNPKVSHDNLVAAFFPLMRDVAVDALREAGLTFDDLDVVIPHNLSLRAWDVLAQVLGVPREKLYTTNISRFGHAVTADNVINHLNAVKDGRIGKGARVAWFVTGFGAHWNCMILEV